MLDKEKKMITDFADGVSIIEGKDTLYTIMFQNIMTGYRYIIRVQKKLFDSAMKERNIFEMTFKTVENGTGMIAKAERMFL